MSERYADLHNFDLDDPSMAPSLCDSLREGFIEDPAIIESQQKLFDRDPQLLAIRDRRRARALPQHLRQRLAAERAEIAAAA